MSVRLQLRIDSKLLEELKEEALALEVSPIGKKPTLSDYVRFILEVRKHVIKRSRSKKSHNE